jgi:DNA primase
VAGRIRDDDIAEVREKARIDEVVSAYVTLRNAGGGSQKGLCPFHDEKSPSFHVTPPASSGTASAAPKAVTSSRS